MPNYMVIVKDCNGLGSEFFDSYDDADFYCSDIDTSAVIEIYERVYTEDGESYEFLSRY